MRLLTRYATIFLLLVCYYADAQKKKVVLVDVGHGQKFYSDPADGKSSDLVPTDRLKYMIGELSKNAEAANATVAYQKSAITAADLAKADLLFIHVPSTKYTAEEVKSIQDFVGKGGSLFVICEEDYWATLDQINVNDILKPFEIAFKGNNPSSAPNGAHSSATTVTKTKYKIPSHGARIVEGGKPFAFNDEAEKDAIAVSKEVKGGGKIVAMGEGMSSLYMASWQEVKDYQPSPFMGEVIAWLLK